MDDIDIVDTEMLFGNEFSAKDRCQQLGIQIDNAQRGSGDDRFKYLCLLVFLFLRYTQPLEGFDDSSLNSFFDNVIPVLQKNAMRYKNPLTSVLAAYVCLEYEPKFRYSLNISKFNFVKDTIIPTNEEYFKKNGVTIIDLVRYIRFYENSVLNE